MRFWFPSIGSFLRLQGCKDRASNVAVTDNPEIAGVRSDGMRGVEPLPEDWNLTSDVEDCIMLVRKRATTLLWPGPLGRAKPTRRPARTNESYG